MRTRLLGPMVVVTAMLAAAPVHADGTEDARTHFTRGVELYKESDFRAALIEFQRAYDAAPNFKVLYNLGQTSLELQDYAGALKAFRGYLDGGGSQIPAARKSQVEADLKKAESRVARVEITVNVDGADVAIDDLTIGHSPLHEPVLVSAGRRKIVATKAGLNPVMRVIDVAGGDRPHVSLDLVEQTQATPPVVVVQGATTTEQPQVQNQVGAPVVVRATPGPSQGFYVGVMAYATGALVLGWGVLGGVALASYGDYNTKLSQVGVQASDINGARNQTRAFAEASDIVGSVAVAAAITTVILALTAPSKHPAHEHAHLFISPFAIGIRGEL